MMLSPSSQKDSNPLKSVRSLLSFLVPSGNLKLSRRLAMFGVVFDGLTHKVVKGYHLAPRMINLITKKPDNIEMERRRKNQPQWHGVVPQSIHSH